jgi:signal transduction histidine kinase
MVVNAIQAMPKGGVLTLHTCEEFISPPVGVPATAGGYACLHVEDTGGGMTSEDLRHAFEPFFTIKEVGSGTGLGLSVAHGIVRDHGGWIAATSAVDKGSRFSSFVLHLNRCWRCVFGINRESHWHVHHPRRRL